MACRDAHCSPVFIVKCRICLHKFICVLCVVWDILFYVDGNARITSKKSYTAINHLRFWSDGTELGWFYQYIYNTYIHKRHCRKHIEIWIRGVCSKIWGWSGNRREGWIGLISGVLSSDMVILKVCSSTLFKYGWISSIKANTPYNLPSTTHW